MKNAKCSIIIAVLLIFLCLIQGTAARIGHFWHITDIHYDKNYTLRGDPNQMCWLVDPTSPPEERPSPIGEHDCDAPITLVKSAIEAMKTIHPEPDFIFWTGDDTAHVNDSFFSTEKVVDVISDLTSLIMRAFPDTPVLPVLGNHDLFPQNQAPVGPSLLLTKVANLWKKWLDQFNAYYSFKRDGRYVADLPDSEITVVALNTLLWYEANFITANNSNAADPAAQFAWLDSSIRKIVKRGRKVYLMGHIPPGVFERAFDEGEIVNWYQERYNTKYINIIARHSQNIAAQFFGHNHFDSFRIFVDEMGNPIAYLLLAPQVSPLKSFVSEATGANNPGIRLVTYDSESGEVLEVSQYYMDLEKAIVSGEKDWVLEYNMTELLRLSKISPSSLHRTVLKMKEDREFFDSYYPVNTVQWQNASSCSEQCRNTLLCAYIHIDYSDFVDCTTTHNSSRIATLATLTLVMILVLHFINRS